MVNKFMLQTVNSESGTANGSSPTADRRPTRSTQTSIFRQFPEPIPRIPSLRARQPPDATSPPKTTRSEQPLRTSIPSAPRPSTTAHVGRRHKAGKWQWKSTEDQHRYVDPNQEAEKLATETAEKENHHGYRCRPRFSQTRIQRKR